MIVVTGTKRSGTSLWMQILDTLGFPLLGEKYPTDWETALKEVNPNGFWESTFRDGINWTTNPTKGTYYAPEPYKNHAVKIFMAGIVKTDIAFLDKTIVTVRHWAEYTHSLNRLNALEDQYILTLPEGEEKTRRRNGKELIRKKSLPPEVEWFFENYQFLRDFNLRRYPAKLSSYDDLISDPEKVLSRILPWLGVGKIATAIAAIDPELRNRKMQRPEVKHEFSELFDEFYAALASATIPGSLVEKLNTSVLQLQEQYRQTVVQ